MMKKLISLALTAVFAMGAFTGCSEEQIRSAKFTDGTYRAEFAQFDANGWKDYVEVTIADGELNEVVFDSVNEKEQLKSEDESYKSEMEQMVGTYPAKYNKDLINQFLESGKITSVDIVAGATESTGNFKTLIVEAMKSANSGSTEVVIVENIK
ncbi:MAG: FMN-binding protein [Oscillospiraceae bacterium]|nr:FMN-binding protein [Oscillospiraceae bacterium]